MNEKPNFIDPSDLPKPPNVELENYKKKVFENSPEAMVKKGELSTLLNTEPFDADIFRKQVEDFNEEIKNTKGYDGQYTTIETVYSQHGQLRIYHFPKSDSVKFGYTNLK